MLPDWNRLYETASIQEGLFTAVQAAEIGYSSQLLVHHMQRGRILRVRRGIYRLVHFPPGEHDDLVVFWLWSQRRGVFSHETALSLHGLSDVLPAKAHLSLPAPWRGRRLRFPRNVIPYYADVSVAEQTWVGAVPITSAARTVMDCVRVRLSPELLHQALTEGLAQGLFSAMQVTEVSEYLEGFDHEMRA
jgi:predicted transcriptional regulator of viral defense system